ncbi:2-phosphosulfolactate phosphatase [Nocardioides sp. GXZ039]|uniref:2-phosphosulfolactate phosphatase n=1 Tax=Nocardioides sp. GXZ039 TaxID=3136018 RepID=UPI0030F4233C
MVDPAHTQGRFRVRLEWGASGAATLASGSDLAVVVDVLSFTTTLSVALERGMTVYPYRWRDDGAAAYAAERDAVLAVGRLEARHGQAGVSLSPAALAEAPSEELPARLVLPSPNGSAISFALADSGATVVGACLRNAAAVAAWLSPRLASGASVAVIPAGERWPDGTLRPAVEDLWGAGAVLARLTDAVGADGFSPEARFAASAFEQVAPDLATALLDCASGRELVEKDFAADVAAASRLDHGRAVPVLAGEAFEPAG